MLDGEGQVALIIGEAGIGKSRLVQRFHEHIAGAPHTWIEAAAGAFFQNTPFYPVAEMLKQALAWRGDEPAEQQLTQLESALEMAGLKPAEALNTPGLAVAAADLSGGGTRGNVTLKLNTTATERATRGWRAANSFTGNQTISGSLTATVTSGAQLRARVRQACSAKVRRHRAWVVGGQGVQVNGGSGYTGGVGLVSNGELRLRLR